MLLNVFNVIYVLVALAMIVLILLQRGAGAQAGSGFGSGASATVFGARGASNFLSRSTAVLAGLFFLLSLVMGIYLGKGGSSVPADDLGLMGNAPDAKTAPAVPPPTTGSDVPQAPGAAAPVKDKPAVPAAAPASDVPAAPTAAAAAKPAATDKPAAADKPATPAAAGKNDATKTDGEKKKSDKPKGK